MRRPQRCHLASTIRACFRRGRASRPPPKTLIQNISVAIIGNAGSSSSALELGEAEAAARKLGLDVQVMDIRRVQDIAAAFGALKDGMQALYVCPDPLVNANHARINTLALGARLPTMHPFRDFLGTGGFMSYGANPADRL